MKHNEGHTSIVDDEKKWFELLPEDVHWIIIHKGRDYINHSVARNRKLVRWMIVSKKYQNLVYKSIRQFLDMAENVNYKPFYNIHTISYPNWGHYSSTMIFTDEYLKSLTNLTHLNVPLDAKTSNECLSNLSTTNLQFLYVHDEANGVMTNETIQRFTNLKSLNITVEDGEDFCRITDDGIVGLTNITALNVDSHISGRGLKGMKNLRVLGLGYETLCTNNDLKLMTNLEVLELVYNNAITGEMLTSLPKLRSLHVHGNGHITNKDLINLTNITNLSLIDLYIGDPLTDDGLKEMTNLTSLDIDSDSIFTNRSISCLTNLKELYCNDIVTGNCIKGLTKLTYLHLGRNAFIHDDELKLLTNLEELSLSLNESITDNGIRGLTNLTRLDLLFNSTITSHGIENLDRLGHDKSIEILRSDRYAFFRKTSTDGDNAIIW